MAFFTNAPPPENPATRLNNDIYNDIGKGTAAAGSQLVLDGNASTQMAKDRAGFESNKSPATLQTYENSTASYIAQAEESFNMSAHTPDQEKQFHKDIMKVLGEVGKAVAPEGGAQGAAAAINDTLHKAAEMTGSGPVVGYVHAETKPLFSNTPQ